MSETTLNAKSIRSWCMKQPRAKVVRVKCEDDSVQDIPCPETQGGACTWTSVAESIEALEPVLLQAFDADPDKGGKLLRVMRDGYEEAHNDSEPRVVPIPAAVATDPHEARLAHFANLLAESYRFNTQIAFQKLLEVTELWQKQAAETNQRLERIEVNARRRDQSVIEQLQDALMQQGAAGADGKPAPLGQSMMDTFLQNLVLGKMQAAQEEASNGASNGKTNGKGAQA